MKNVLIILFVCVVATIGQINWTSRAKVRHYEDFFTGVMQETVYEIERRGFSTLTLTNITQNVNLAMFNWHINGTANYTNGFLVSIQKIDVTSMQELVGATNAIVRGNLNFHDVKLGYDVFFYDLNGTVHTFTADYDISLIYWRITIQQNSTTKEITLFFERNLSGGQPRMVFRPATNLTEVLTRGQAASQHGPGVETWRNTLEPIILDIIKNKFPFPEVCFSHCAKK